MERTRGLRVPEAKTPTCLGWRFRQGEPRGDGLAMPPRRLICVVNRRRTRNLLALLVSGLCVLIGSVAQIRKRRVCLSVDALMA